MVEKKTNLRRKSRVWVQRAIKRRHGVEKSVIKNQAEEVDILSQLSEEAIGKLCDEDYDLAWRKKDIEENIPTDYSPDDIRTAIDKSILPPGLTIESIEGLILNADQAPYEDG